MLGQTRAEEELKPRLLRTLRQSKARALRLAQRKLRLPIGGDLNRFRQCFLRLVALLDAKVVRDIEIRLTFFPRFRR